MSQSPLPDEPINSPTPPPRRRSIWRRLLFLLAIVAVGGVAGGAWWAWVFIQEKLAPLVADSLTKELERPVAIGKLERFSLNSLRFGRSQLPATPTDSDRASVEAVEVQFNPWQVLWKRQLPLKVTLVNPEAFLEQESNGLWLNIKTKPKQDKPPVEVKLEQLRLENAKVELLAQPKPKQKRQSVRLKKVAGFIDLFDQNRRFSYYLRGDSEQKGTFRVRGESQRIGDKDLISKINAEGINFQLAEIDRLIRLPVDIKSGRTTGKVDVTINPDASFELKGRAKLQKVSLTAPGTPKPINDANGDVELENMTVKLKNLKAKFATLPFVANGQIDPKTGFDLNARLDNVSIPEFFKTFNVKTPVPIKGNVKTSVDLTGPVNAPILTGVVQNINAVTVDRLLIDQARGKFRLDTKSGKMQLVDLDVVPKVGGRITGQGVVGVTAPQPVQLALQANNIPGDAVSALYSNAKPPFQIGGVNARINVTGTAANAVTVADWQAPNSTYNANGTVAILENGKRIELRRLNAQAYGGAIDATGELVNQVWRAKMNLNGIQLAQANPQLNGSANGTVNLQGRLDDLSLNGTIADAVIQAQTYGGTINATGQLRNQNWQADVNLAGISLAQANPQLRGAANGKVRLSGNVNALSVAKTQADGQVTLSEGISVINRPIAANFNWDGRQINLKSATADGLDARGMIYAKVEGTPAVTGIDLQVKTRGIALAGLPLGLPSAVQVDGNADFAGRLYGGVSRPNLSGALALNGLSVNGIGFELLRGQIVSSNQRGLVLDLKGDRDRLAINLDGRNQPIAVAVKRGELEIDGRSQNGLFNIALKELPLSELQAFGFGIPGASGKIAGKASINLATLEIPDADFTLDEPRLGAFPNGFQGNQIRARLSYLKGVAKGNIALTQPQFGNIKSTDAVTNFVYANNRLRISDFTVTKGDSQFTVAGNLNLTNLANPEVDGFIKIKQGRIEDILAALQVFELNDLTRLLNPATAIAPNYGTIVAIQPKPIGAPGSSDAPLKSQLEKLAESIEKIRQIADDRRQLIRRDSANGAPQPLWPELADLRGLFDSEIVFSKTAKGVEVNQFDLTASKVEWRPYRGYIEIPRGKQIAKLMQNDNRKLDIQEIKVSATYLDNILNIKPSTIQIDDATVEFQLSYGGELTTGQVKVANLPVTQIQKFYPQGLANLPLIVGELNLNASLNGDRENIGATGEINLSEGGINGNALSQAGGLFYYADGRLGLDAKLQADAPEPMLIQGEIPLPIGKIVPKNNDIALNVKVKNEGLALLNVLNLPITWQSGEGSVNLDIKGSLFSPVADGKIILNDASFKLSALPQPLTNVNGQISFDQSLIRVDSLVGDFSKGSVAMKGTIPILFGRTDTAFRDIAASSNSRDLERDVCLGQGSSELLNLRLDKIALAYKGLYQGGVQGCINIAGSLFQPSATGEITLSNGQVLLADEIAAAGVNDSEGGGESGGLTFNNLRLTLGRGVQIIKAPLVNFVADGKLEVNGNVNAPQPTGEIALRSGQVNLFTTQFVLARGRKHTATFKAEQGLDPDLDIRLISSVSEVRRNPIVNQNVTSEINDSPLFATNFGTIETIKIQAAVSGRASQLFDNLELSSSPGRSRNEIIGLLGGGFVNTLGRGDSTIGIANLAGSALLTNIQGFIGNALGLSDFRLFPTVTSDQDKRSSTLGLAAELGVDISPSFSASVLKVLTSSDAPQFGLTYRINQNFLFRGSTDFFGDSRAVIEYESRF
jgi:translocation and assembly module TamB